MIQVRDNTLQIFRNTTLADLTSNTSKQE